MESYAIALKNERTKSYDRIAFFIAIINLAAFVYLLIASDQKHIRVKAIGGLVFITVCLALDFFAGKKKIDPEFPFRRIMDFGILMAWIAMEYWIIAGINLLLGTFYFVARREMNVTVTKNYIMYPSLPAKHIRWSELSKVILKDGLLTIDFKNNKLIQQEIDESISSVNENRFNEFCQERLTAKAPGREGTQG